MSRLVPFTFENVPVRVIEIDGEPWFVGKDVAERLGYANPTDAMNQHCRGVAKRYPIVDALGRTQEARILSEPDVLRLIVGSKLPAAERFEKWVFEEVLPAIRKTGGYGAPQVDPANLSRLQLIELAMQAERERLALETKVAADQPKVEFYDRFANAEGLYGLQNAGRVLGHPPNKFVEQLKTIYLFYQGGSLVPRSEYQDRGIFKVMALEGGGQARYQTYITPKGLQYLAHRLKKTEPLPAADLLSRLA